ncbi:MAG: ABC-2 family transporter protein [Chloroflexi bacterium]|nr:ABC-2 family transporter protein [Chloroflexota bacterium]
MSHTFNIYRHLISVNIRGQMQYRVSFLFDVLATALITALSFGSIALILQRFNNIAGWTVYELAFLFGMAETAFGTMDIIFSGFDPPYFGRRVRLGTFDQMLLRPVNLVVQVLGSQFILRRFGRIIQGSIILLISLTHLEIQWTAVKILMLPVVFISLVIFFGGLFIIGATLSFWTVESLEVVNIFTYGGTELMQYPMEIYPNLIRTFFTYILPAIFLLYYPTLYILDKPDPLGMPPFSPFLAPFVAVAVFIVAFAFWNYGLRFYQSTGS